MIVDKSDERTELQARLDDDQPFAHTLKSCGRNTFGL